MIPDRVSKVYLDDVPFNCMYHEWEVEGVVGPVLYSVVYENLFMCFDVSGSMKVESVPFSVPLGIFPTFV